jgi:4-deoxy-L-threo-5-hexosulose-uronate ketol-isomerase
MIPRYSPAPEAVSGLSTEQLRAAFLIDRLFPRDQVELVYTDADRAVIGSAVPQREPLALAAPPALRSAYFCERRELGILNVGGDGAVEVDGRLYPMAHTDALYVGRGTKAVRFASNSDGHPAAFYLVSYPAHAAHPVAHARLTDAAAVELGSAAEANRRTIHKYIHPAGIPSCQLVMGFTRLHEGSVWNTMPPHTHARRTEVYLYFDMASATRVVHFMGEPKQTRHLVVADRQAVISPSWSIHAGCGTGPYAFCWCMGGENQDFDDMDRLTAGDLL